MGEDFSTDEVVEKAKPRAKSAKKGLRDVAKEVGFRALLVLLGAVFLIASMVLLRSYVGRGECYQVDARSLVPKDLPSWAGPGVRTDLSRLPGIPARFSLMTPGICERVAHAFEANPWVDHVVSVQKVYPNHLTVDLALRRPVAGVRVAGKYYLIDEAGRRLSVGINGWPQGADALPVIVTADATMPPLGAVWPSEAAKAGASVAKTLLDSRDKLPTRFAMIDCTNIGPRRDLSRSDIVLVTYEGTYVRWGRSPLVINSPGELSPDEKVVKMVTFEKKLGPLSSFKYVDIRFDNIQHGPCVRPLADADFIR